MKKIILIAAIAAVFSTAAHAGGGVAGATEVTQYLNYGKLVEQAATGATTAENMITQAMNSTQSLTQFDKNFINAAVQGSNGSWTSAQQLALETAADAARDLAASSTNYLDLMNADMASMSANRVSPSQYWSTVSSAARQGNTNAQKQISATQAAQKDLQRKSQDAAAAAASAQNVAGEVQGLQLLAVTAAQGNQIAISNASALQTIIAQQAQDRADREAAKIPTIEWSKNYGSAREAEQQGIQNGLKYKAK